MLVQPRAVCEELHTTRGRHILLMFARINAHLADQCVSVMSIPSIKDLSAPVIVSEIGTDMSRFPSAAHLISWACVCPRSDESAGKRRSNRQRKGANWLKTTLVQCALAAAKKKGSYLEAQFYRLKPGAAPTRRSWPSSPRS